MSTSDFPSFTTSKPFEIHRTSLFWLTLNWTEKRQVCNLITLWTDVFCSFALWIVANKTENRVRHSTLATPSQSLVLIFRRSYWFSADVESTRCHAHLKSTFRGPVWPTCSKGGRGEISHPFHHDGKGLFSFVWCVYAQDQGNRVVNWNIMKSHLRQSLDIESLERKERLVEGLIVITILNVISPKST